MGDSEFWLIFDISYSGCVSTPSPLCSPTSVTTASWGSPVSARMTSWSSWTTSRASSSAPAVARTSATPGTWWSTSRTFTLSTSTSFVMIIRTWPRSSNRLTADFLPHFTTSYFHLWSSDIRLINLVFLTLPTTVLSSYHYHPLLLCKTVSMSPHDVTF